MIKNIAFFVKEFDCPSCYSNIEKIMNNLNGINEYSVDILEKKLLLSFDDEIIDINDIIKKLKKFGYSANLI